MTYHRPYHWTPMYPNVPMLGQTDPSGALLTVAAAEDAQRGGNGAPGGMLKAALIVGSIVLGLAVAGWASPKPRANPRRRRRRRTSRRRASRRRTTRRRTTRRRATRRNRTSRRRRRTSKVAPNRLTAAKRARIPRRYFVFPDRPAPGGGKGTFPLDTARRARAAIDYLRMGRVRSASDFNAIRSKIIKLWPEVWAAYGRGNVTWQKTKRAKAKRARSRARTMRRRRRAA